jgi:hypothetical protein
VQEQLAKSEGEAANEEYRKKLNSISAILNVDYKI